MSKMVLVGAMGEEGAAEFIYWREAVVLIGENIME